MAQSTRTAPREIIKLDDAENSLVIPEDGMKTIYVLDKGAWIEKEVEDDYEEEDLSVVADEDDVGMPSHEWFEGRGQKFAFKWLNIDEKYSGRARMQGWVPVSPAHYQDPRYKVIDKPGLGKVITYMDNYLCEMPKARQEGLEKIRNAKQRKEQIERLYGLNVDQTGAKYEGYAALTVKADEHGPEGDYTNNLPWDSPLAKTMRDLEGRLMDMAEEAASANRLRKRGVLR